MPEDTECYVQETGRGGRDGKPCAALLLSNKKARNVSKPMKEYQDNMTTCRRDFLFRDTDDYVHREFDELCSCCDICAMECLCSRCSEKLGQFTMMQISNS